MRHTIVDVSAAKSEEGSLELTEGLIRVHAYRFMTRLKVFARLIKTTTATDDNVKVCEWLLCVPFFRGARVATSRAKSASNKKLARPNESDVTDKNRSILN